MLDTSQVRAFLDEEHVQLAAGLTDWVDGSIRPLDAPSDDAASRVQARDVLTMLGQGNWLGCIPDQDLRSCCLIREALAAGSPLADTVFALQALGATPIVLRGTAQLQERWLPAVRSGEAMAAFAMTERDAGSDVAAIKTRAVRDGDAYVLQGTKTLISNAGIADFYTVFASTDPARGRDGLSCFVVPTDTPGFRFTRAQILSAPHPLGEISFDTCRVPERWRLGEEGDGFAIGMETLERIRPTVGAAACGMAARALDEARRHAIARRQFGKPLAAFQLTQAKLARMATDLAAARLLVYRAAWGHDTGTGEGVVPSSMAKAFATEAAQRIVDDAVQILGGAGVLADHPVDRLYRAVRALRIYEGTTEIQHLVIGRHLLRQRDTT